MYPFFKPFIVAESAVSALAGAHTARCARSQRTALAAVARLTPVPLRRRGWLGYAASRVLVALYMFAVAHGRSRAPPGANAPMAGKGVSSVKHALYHTLVAN
jgi:hypothetical protein